MCIMHKSRTGRIISVGEENSISLTDSNIWSSVFMNFIRIRKKHGHAAMHVVRPDSFWIGMNERTLQLGESIFNKAMTV